MFAQLNPTVRHVGLESAVSAGCGRALCCDVGSNVANIVSMCFSSLQGTFISHIYIFINLIWTLIDPLFCPCSRPTKPRSEFCQMNLVSLTSEGGQISQQRLIYVSVEENILIYSACGWMSYQDVSGKAELNRTAGGSWVRSQVCTDSHWLGDEDAASGDELMSVKHHDVPVMSLHQDVTQ